MDQYPHDEVEELPRPSFWPILLAFGMVLIAIGIIFTLVISVLGVALMLASMIGWMLENRATPEERLADDESE